MWSVTGSMRSVMNRTTAFDRSPPETIEVVSLRIPTTAGLTLAEIRQVLAISDTGEPAGRGIG
jgi:hypothetical protein